MPGQTCVLTCGRWYGGAVLSLVRNSYQHGESYVALIAIDAT